MNQKLFCNCNDRFGRIADLNLQPVRDYDYPLDESFCDKCQYFKWFYIRKEDEPE